MDSICRHLLQFRWVCIHIRDKGKKCNRTKYAAARYLRKTEWFRSLYRRMDRFILLGVFNATDSTHIFRWHLIVFIHRCKFLLHVKCWQCFSYVFSFFQNGWVNGVPFAMALYTLLFTVCKLGDEVESAVRLFVTQLQRSLCFSYFKIWIFQNDMMLEKLQEFKWYKLPPQYQRTMVHAIHRRQNAGVIQMGPFRALSYETASDVIFLANAFLSFKCCF